MKKKIKKLVESRDNRLNEISEKLLNIAEDFKWVEEVSGGLSSALNAVKSLERKIDIRESEEGGSIWNKMSRSDAHTWLSNSYHFIAEIDRVQYSMTFLHNHFTQIRSKAQKTMRLTESLLKSESVI